MSSKKLNPFKDFQSDQIQRSSRKIFSAHYACRNAALNLTPVTGTANGFIFQIISSLIESWGVRLTWFDCKPIAFVAFQLSSPSSDLKVPSRDLTKLWRRLQRERQKALNSMSKTTTLHVHHAFLYISLPSLHNCNVKFWVDLRTGTARWLLLSLSKLGRGPLSLVPT